jgi:hypothetical protein
MLAWVWYIIFVTFLLSTFVAFAVMDDNTRIVLLSLIATVGGVALAVIAIFAARRPKNGNNGDRAP